MNKLKKKKSTHKKFVKIFYYKHNKQQKQLKIWMQVFDLIFKLVFDFLGGYSNTIKKRFSPSIRIPPQKNDYFVWQITSKQ